MIKNNVPNEDFFMLNRGFSNYVDTTEMPRHRWYYYKEGFSPYLVEKAIEQTGITKKDTIIDPFNGSGTSTLTAALSGYNSVGIEVNPFTSFLSSVKVSNTSIYELTKIESNLLMNTKNGKKSTLLGFSTFSKKDNLSKWLFNDEVLNCFEAGWEFTKKISSYNVQKVVRLALISTAMQNCNAKRDGKCLRYRNHWEQKEYNKITFINTLQNDLQKIKSDLENSPILTKSKIINGDCRLVLKDSSIDNFKLCVTSPPYLNTFDYTDIYRPELFLGKFIDNRIKLYNLRLKTVRSHIQAKWKIPIKNDFGVLYGQTINFLNENKDNLMHKSIPIMVQAYFEDIQNILKLLKTKCAKNGQVWLVVSNSAYAGYVIPVDLIIADIASMMGWYLKEIGVLRYVKKRKTKYSPEIQDLRESVIILSQSKI